jgi:hypothetical protein
VKVFNNNRYKFLATVFAPINEDETGAVTLNLDAGSYLLQSQLPGSVFTGDCYDIGNNEARGTMTAFQTKTCTVSLQSSHLFMGVNGQSGQSYNVYVCNNNDCGLGVVLPYGNSNVADIKLAPGSYSVRIDPLSYSGSGTFSGDCQSGSGDNTATGNIGGFQTQTCIFSPR